MMEQLRQMMGGGDGQEIQIGRVTEEEIKEYFKLHNRALAYRVMSSDMKLEKDGDVAAFIENARDIATKMAEAVAAHNRLLVRCFLKVASEEQREGLKYADLNIQNSSGWMVAKPDKEKAGTDTVVEVEEEDVICFKITSYLQDIIRNQVKNDVDYPEKTVLALTETLAEIDGEIHTSWITLAETNNWDVRTEMTMNHLWNCVYAKLWSEDTPVESDGES